MGDKIIKAIQLIREGRWFEGVILILIFIGVIYFFIGGIREDENQRESVTPNQYNVKPVTDPEPYQQFFTSLVLLR